MSPGVTRPPPRFSTESTSTMSSTTPGRLSGSSEARPTHAMRSLWVRMAALLQISDPVQRRPMLVSRRTVTGVPLAARAEGAGGERARPGVPASCAVTCHSSSVPLMAPRQAPRHAGSRATDGGAAGCGNQHIGSVTVLHYRVPVQAVHEEGRTEIAVLSEDLTVCAGPGRLN